MERLFQRGNSQTVYVTQGHRFSKLFIVFFTVLLVLTSFTSCKEDPKEDPLKPALTPYPAKLPPGFPPVNLAHDNPLTVEGFELGRMLYYDKALHPNQSMACASCHVQKNSFSMNNNDGVLPHVNLAWKRHYLWNGKLKGTLEDAMRFEVEDFFATDLSHIRAKPEYRERFKVVFGTDEINSHRAAYAIAQFLTTLMSYQSKYDVVVAKKAAFTPSEARGEALFFSEKGDCFHCHAPPLFSDMMFHNNGIDSVFEGINRGRFEVTGKLYDIGMMSTPTLRNIGVTAPYMHDGRFEKLEDVIDHYNAGIRRSTTLDPIMLKNDSDGKRHLTTQEKEDLKAFLLTLTDTTFLNDKRFSSPF
jgi:cytochrome c peroxidase